MERAITYLMLRMHHLSRFPGVFYPPLQPAFDHYVDHQVLLPRHVNHILEIDIKVTRTLPQFCLSNLLTVYAYDRALAEAIKHIPEDKRGFIAGMRSHLRRNLFLSPQQVQGVAKWLEKIPRQPKLDANGFCWAWGDDLDEPANSEAGVNL